MNKLDELINKLCPNGVKFKKISDVSVIKRGERVTKKDLTEDGLYPVMSGGTSFMGRMNSYNKEANTITISSYGAAGYVDFINERFWANDVCLTIIPKKEINNRFLYYVLKNNQNYFYTKTTKAIPDHIPTEIIESTEIPVPPLEVQCEIVRILDNFAELTAELTAELSLRKSQYKFYLNSFFGKNLNEASQKGETFKLNEIGDFQRGKRFCHRDDKGVGVPAIHYGELYTYYGISAYSTKTFIDEKLRNKMRYASTNDVIIVGAGENRTDIGVGVAWLGKDDVAVHDACYRFRTKQNPKYISYFLQSDLYHNQIYGKVFEGKICALSADAIGSSVIPVPSIEEQNRIVHLLDKFNSYCNDISEGLPAEIESRKKQYEYYRDKLLTLKRLED